MGYTLLYFSVKSWVQHFADLGEGDSPPRTLLSMVGVGCVRVYEILTDEGSIHASASI